MAYVQTSSVGTSESGSSLNIHDADHELGEKLPTDTPRTLAQQSEVAEERKSPTKGPELDNVIQDFLPHEVQRWRRLTDCMLGRVDFEMYIVKVDLNDNSSWSMDEAFGSFLLDCLDEDLAHGDTVTSQDAGDAACDDRELLHLFPHECIRWERLRNRMMSIPYIDRYTKSHPDWSDDELFTCCLLDRLEEQFENELEETKAERESRLATNDDSDFTAEEEPVHEDEEVMQEDEETGRSSSEEEEEDEDDLSMEDDPNDPDYKPYTRNHLKKASAPSEKTVETQTAGEQEKETIEKAQNLSRRKLKVYICDICNKPIDNKREALEHYKTTHWNPSEDVASQGKTNLPPDSKFFATVHLHCFECDTYVEDLRKHKQTCPGVHCKECGKQFQKRRILHYHMKVRHTMNKEDWKKKLCHYCGRRFYSCTDLNVHIQRHRGEVVRNFKCDTCGKAFTTAERLARHNAIHLEERPFACSYCGQRFTQKHNMKLHTRIHTGVKPYKCDLCGEAFTHNVSLKNHRKKVHGIDWWKNHPVDSHIMPKQ